MSSEEAKRVKKEEDGDEDDEKSLSSIYQNKNKKSLSLKDAKLKKLGPKLKKEDESDEEFTPDKKTPINVKPKKEATASAGTKKTPVNKVKKEEAGNANTKKTPNSEVKKEKPGTSDKKKSGKISEQNAKKKEEPKKGGKVEAANVKKTKKVYDLPGQKRDPPEERDPLRIFYESLHKQIPNSEMAGIWMMESGLLAKEVAKKLFEEKRNKAQQQKLGSPMKTTVTVKKQTDSSVSVKKKTTTVSVSTENKKKRKIKDDSDGSSGQESDDDFVIGKKIKKQKV